MEWEKIMLTITEGVQKGWLHPAAEFDYKRELKQRMITGKLKSKKAWEKLFHTPIKGAGYYKIEWGERFRKVYPKQEVEFFGDVYKRNHKGIELKPIEELFDNYHQSIRNSFQRRRIIDMILMHTFNGDIFEFLFQVMQTDHSRYVCRYTKNLLQNAYKKNQTAVRTTLERITDFIADFPTLSYNYFIIIFHMIAKSKIEMADIIVLESLLDYLAAARMCDADSKNREIYRLLSEKLGE